MLIKQWGNTFCLFVFYDGGGGGGGGGEAHCSGMKNTICVEKMSWNIYIFACSATFSTWLNFVLLIIRVATKKDDYLTIFMCLFSQPNIYSGRKLDQVASLAPMPSDLWGRFSGSISIMHQSPVGLWREKLHWRKERSS